MDSRSRVVLCVPPTEVTVSTVWLSTAVSPKVCTRRSLLVHDTTRQPSSSQDAHSFS